ncbi:MAG: polyprenyl diphosphate synthase, partial [Negativicutes bacterium]|nr:polyprenyl diphosphate synthase [Negativicutes bacterium]
MSNNISRSPSGVRPVPDGVDAGNIPNHVAIIMDGNGRWARQRGMPRVYGHSAGAKTLKEIALAADSIGIRHLTVYAFSTENWRRRETEVSFLMELVYKKIQEHIDEIIDRNVVWRFIGRIDQLSPKIQDMIRSAEEKTAGNTGNNFNIAINYGGRAEIVDAVKNIAAQVAAGEVNPATIDEETIAARLYQPRMPDVDLLIRPGGDLRISNFLLWQVAYAEIWTTPLYWPD